MKRFYARFFLLCLLSVALTGCLRPVPLNAHLTLTKKPELSPTPAVIDGKGWHIMWRSRNTEISPQKALPVLVADAETGSLSNETDPPTIRLNNVLAHLYKEGKRSADIQAAQIEANRADEIIHATGGVTLRSITEPPDTVITADAMTWDTSATTLIAEGHAHITRLARGKTAAFSQTGNKIVYDMQKDTFAVQ